MERNLDRASEDARAGIDPGGPTGSFLLLDDQPSYRISGYDRLEPFLVNLASDTDLWMFISSRGGLTAGRVDADGSLFPYVTSDQLHDVHHHTGPVTLIRVVRAESPPLLWEPFSEATVEETGIERNLYKNLSGNQITFEEINHDLGLAFRYRWAGCDAFGWVRTATLENRGKRHVRAEVLDGVRNILPWGAPLQLYQQASNLVDAYKKSEIDPTSNLGIFSLTSGITDRPEALEVLRANTVWCCGLKEFRASPTLDVLDDFRRGRRLHMPVVLNGRRGNYLATTALDLEPEQSARWHLAADIGLDHVRIGDLRNHLAAGEDLREWLDESLRAANENLQRNVASADGLQVTGLPESWFHHFANVLFNNMRGGVFWRNHVVPITDFIDFLRTHNRAAFSRHRARLQESLETPSIRNLREYARATEDADLARLCHEYLPLYFGRRHGDPSRPWNRFEIRVRDRNGEPVLNHEGNWRDIFQNWEALGASFPRFLPGMVARFVNASTVDGFNPYRITREGVDWEVPAPDDPWSNIGYWGDHQIVYLLRLLEAVDRHEPHTLQELLDTEIFSYAEVPYRIKPYSAILKDPRATIVYDSELAARIDERVAKIGNDGKLVLGSDGAVYHVNLLEKLLVPALSKLSNLIPEAGIWMNTQRPEWNDANNALGGGSVSVVTLCSLRRYLAFLADLLEKASDRGLSVSSEVVVWFDRIADVLEQETDVLAMRGLDPKRRKAIMDALGTAFTEYRERVYARSFSGRRELTPSQIARFCRTACAWVDHSIAANRRDDGLYHTYNQLSFSSDGSSVSITRLQEMLEGQVAVLSSGAIEPAEAVAILEQLFASDLYRPDQRSFLLYPARELPGFLGKNIVPDDRIEAIPLARG
ncbi:MAG: hypothetical protein GF328_05740, partial [Candidatus Latescibacteria bacterium]|nr:hypothetical protein [Candidatus Latescibacterota bacterium]